MCFFDQHRFACGDWKWGNFRQHCAREHRIGEACGMKLIMQTVPVQQKCSVCKKITPEMQRERLRAAEVGRINRWLHEGKKYWASIEKSMKIIMSRDPDIYELHCVRNRTSQSIEIGSLLSPQPCKATDCFLYEGHVPPHQSWRPCDTSGCHLHTGHPQPHTEELLVTSRILAARFEETRNEEKERLQALNRVVLSDMGNPQWPTRVENLATPAALTSPNPTPRQCVRDFSAKTTISGLLYLDLDFSSQQIRLFELYPRTEVADIQGSFHYVELTACPAYIALSYAWGDAADIHQITVGGGGTIKVRKNLWEFLRQQSSAISEPQLLWIDAICINQPNVHERNHRVKLMKQIYAKASEVYIWLGREADNSGLAMEYIAKKGTRKLRHRGPGFQGIWTGEDGRALSHLFERPYWERMWIIQEIVHAEKITVCCGAKNFEWGILESLYQTLKTFEDTHWLMHHNFANRVLHSPAAVMIWQRAHWRHPQTPTPSLQTLIEVFHKWKCKDIRDKVFALVGMASSETSIVPDYSWSARQVYFAVHAGQQFSNLLSQILGLSIRDIELPEQDLLEYKPQTPKQLILRKRAEYKSGGLESV